MTAPRRLPAPWRVVEHEESFEVQAANGQNLAFVYFEDAQERRWSLKRLTKDEAGALPPTSRSYPRS